MAEISLPKLVLAWVLLIGLPGFLLGIAPLVVSAWLGKVSTQLSVLFSGAHLADCSFFSVHLVY